MFSGVYQRKRALSSDKARNCPTNKGWRRARSFSTEVVDIYDKEGRDCEKSSSIVSNCLTKT
jgi:hypothetical protein